MQCEAKRDEEQRAHCECENIESYSQLMGIFISEVPARMSHLALAHRDHHLHDASTGKVAEHGFKIGCRDVTLVAKGEAPFVTNWIVRIMTGVSFDVVYVLG